MSSGDDIRNLQQLQPFATRTTMTNIDFGLKAPTATWIFALTRISCACQLLRNFLALFRISPTERSQLISSLSRNNLSPAHHPLSIYTTKSYPCPAESDLAERATRSTLALRTGGEAISFAEPQSSCWFAKDLESELLSNLKHECLGRMC